MFRALYIRIRDIPYPMRRISCTLLLFNYYKIISLSQCLNVVNTALEQLE